MVTGGGGNIPVMQPRPTIICTVLVCCTEASEILGNDDIAIDKNFQRTGIFVVAETAPGQNIFIRGGISSHIRPGCTNNATTDPCGIPIQHRVVPVDPGSSYGQWSVGDHFLDWYGPEDDQGDYNDIKAFGTPLMWTTSVYEEGGATIEEEGHGYTAFNRFGEHYWYVDLDMDCSYTEGGWFEFKVYTIAHGWEPHIDQYEYCAGQPDRPRPFITVNHLGLCGKLNVFVKDQKECIVYEMPENPDLHPPDTCGQIQMFEDGIIGPSSPPVEYVPPVSEYIVNGQASSLGRWPWQGVLQFDNVIGGCGAVLIDRKWALTASHCVYNTWPSMLSVRVGEQNLAIKQQTEQKLDVLRIHIHDCYQSNDCGDIPHNDYDLAILELETEADLSSYVANPACLPFNYGLDDFVGDLCYATGFGETQGSGDRYRLYEINAPVHSHLDCVEEWGSDKVTVRQVCGGTLDSSACGGDSGSPLVCWKDNRWVVAGVTSWGNSACQGQLSVFSRVTSFMDWLIDVTGLTFCSNQNM